MKTQNILDWVNQKNKQHQLGQLQRARLAEQAERHLWRETPNDYREKDLGFKKVCGQRVRAKKVLDPSGLSFLILDDSFKVSPNPVYSTR